MKSRIALLACLSMSFVAQAETIASNCSASSFNNTYKISYSANIDGVESEGKMSFDNIEAANQKVAELNAQGISSCRPFGETPVVAEVVQPTLEIPVIEPKIEVTYVQPKMVIGFTDDRPALRVPMLEQKLVGGTAMYDGMIGGNVQHTDKKLGGRDKTFGGLSIGANKNRILYTDRSYLTDHVAGAMVIGGSGDGMAGGIQIHHKGSKGGLSSGRAVKLFLGGRDELDAQLMIKPGVSNNLEGALGLEGGLALDINKNFFVKAGPLAQGKFSLMVNEENYASLQAGGAIEMVLFDNVLVSASSAKDFLSTSDKSTRTQYRGSFYLRLGKRNEKGESNYRLGTEFNATVTSVNDSDRSFFDKDQTSKVRMDGTLNFKGNWQ